MKVQITIKQEKRKPKIIVSSLNNNESPFSAMRKLWEAEQLLNSVLSSDLKITTEIVSD